MIDFPNSPANGDVFTYGNSSWVWNAATSQWRTAVIALNPKVQRFSGNGSTTQFTLNSVPPSVNFLDVYITGAYQQKDTYTVANNIITFSEAPPTGTDNIEVEWGSTLDIGMPSDNSVSTIKLQDASVTTAKLGLASVTPSRLSAGAPTWDANGLLTLAQGQIKFPATQSASSDANTLDDYEEGTFTPTVLGFSTAGTGTYNGRAGRYTKIGNRCFIQVWVDWTNLSGASGALGFGGLPFTAINTTYAYNPFVTYMDGSVSLSANNVVQSYVPINDSRILLTQYVTGGGNAATVPLDSTGAIMITGSYEVA